jgi:SAM-dependent methyltransferase
LLGAEGLRFQRAPRGRLPSSGEYIRIRTTGRRSGRPHDVLVRFVTVEGKIVVFPQNTGRQDWLANILGDPSVTVFGAGKQIGGTARVRWITGLRDPVLGVFTRKYGIEEVRKRYWGQRRYVEIEVLRESAAGDFAELVYADLEAAFDGVAENYDHHIMDNPMNLWLRNRSVHHLSQSFHAGDLVLEIGCGTGTETLEVAKRGVKVIACDISSKMLSVLRDKAAAAGLGDLIVPVHGHPGVLKEELRRLGYGRVDGAYSTYGAVNTEPRLEGMFRELHDLVKEDGLLLLGVWNKYCLYEILGYALRGRPSMSVARLRNPVPVGKSRFCIASWAYSVGSLDRIASPFFKLRKVYGVEMFLPPSNLTRYLPRGRALGLLKGLETTIEGTFPWNRLGDHFLALYSRRD